MVTFSYVCGMIVIGVIFFIVGEMAGEVIESRRPE